MQRRLVFKIILLFLIFNFCFFPCYSFAASESVLLTGQLTDFKKLADDNFEITIKHQEGVARFTLDQNTRVQATVSASEIKTGDRVLSDGQGTLLPVQELDSKLPERPEIQRPPDKPDASRPESAPQQTPAGPPPQEGQAPPPPGAEAPQTPPPADSGDEEQKQEQAGPQKKKPWEIELENAKEPEDSLKPDEFPLSEATLEEMQAAQQVVVVKKVNDVGKEEKLIELQLVNPEGKIEVCRIPPDKLIYRLLELTELNTNVQVKLEVAKEEKTLHIKSVTLL